MVNNVAAKVGMTPSTCAKAQLENAISMGADSLPPPLLRVLVVDDNPDSATSLAMVLRQLGYEVEIAGDGAAALQAAQAGAVDVVLLDIGLPKMDGHEVARRLSASCGPRPFLIAVTGYGGLEEKRRCEDAGFDLHLLKPVDLEVLQCILRARKRLLNITAG
jgi:CheY-like chemotaxis protein